MSVEILTIPVHTIHIEMLEDIKQINSLENDAEVVRFCIKQTYDFANVRVSTELKMQIKDLIMNNQKLQSHNIRDVAGFIELAIQSQIDALTN